MKDSGRGCRYRDALELGSGFGCLPAKHELGLGFSPTSSELLLLFHSTAILSERRSAAASCTGQVSGGLKCRSFLRPGAEVRRQARQPTAGNSNVLTFGARGSTVYACMHAWIKEFEAGVDIAGVPQRVRAMGNAESSFSSTYSGNHFFL
jgi:hypothetical protein